MMDFSVALFLWCMFCHSGVLFSVSASSAPGDEHRLCINRADYSVEDHHNVTYLFNSYNYVNLVTGFFPPPVWSQANMDGNGIGWTEEYGEGFCLHHVRVCDYFTGSLQNNWLFTQYIRFIGAKQVFVNINFNFGECLLESNCNQTSMELYVHYTNSPDPQEREDTSSYQLIGQLEQHDEEEQEATFNITRDHSLEQGFYLGIKDTGSCGIIRQITIYYKVCPGKFEGLEIYPDLPLPPQNSMEPIMANAFCVPNSVNFITPGYVAHPSGTCVYGAVCECALGFEAVLVEHDSNVARCQACSKGTYRSDSDVSCQLCPMNTITTGEAMAECPCIQGYYRKAGEGPAAPCTYANLGPPASITEYCKLIVWDPPESLSELITGYEIYLFGGPTEQLNMTVRKGSTDGYHVIPRNEPFQEFRIRALFHSSGGQWSEIIELCKRQFNFRSPDQLDIYAVVNGLLIWSVPDPNDYVTEYQIRYNNTDSNEFQMVTIETTLNAYSLRNFDKDAEYNIEVQAVNEVGVGNWSRPFQYNRYNSGNIHGTDYVDGVVCVNADGRFNCSCPPGFEGDGKRRGSGCQDINECMEGTDDCNDGYMCVNTQGGFKCRDIDECAEENRHHYCVDNAICVNTIGDFTCICPLSYIGDGRIRGTGCQEFGCFSSTDCHGNGVEGGMIDCCIVGGLSFQNASGQCGNCYSSDKFKSEGNIFFLAIFSNYEVVEYFRIGEIRLAVEPVGRESTTFIVNALGDQTVYTAPDEVTLDSRMLELESVGTRNKGIFIKSETGDPLSVVAFVEEFQSSDTFKVYPCVPQPVTAYEYYAVSVPQSFIVHPPDPDYADDPDYEQEVLDPQGNSAIVIVTTEEDTVLNVTLTQDVSISEARDIVEQIGTDLLRSGEHVSFRLSGRGSTLYLASLDDLTGSHVASNKPIAFITGHECGTLPHNIQYCDHLVEQITPTSTWGKEFIISTIATRREVDTFRIIASRDTTRLSISCGITNISSLSLSTAGEYLEFHVNSTDSCYLVSNQPILLAQFSVSSLVDHVFNSDPFMVIIPPVEQYQSRYIFNTFTGSPFNPGQNYINILLPAGVDHRGLRLDEQILPDDATVTSIQCPDSDTVCATTVQLRVSDAQRHNLNHTDGDAQFSAIVYWLSFRVAHGYPIGMSQVPIALPAVSFKSHMMSTLENVNTVAITLMRTGDTSVPATVFLNTAEIYATHPALGGEDFIPVSALAVGFETGETVATVNIDIVNDDTLEENEVFEVFLSTSPGVYIMSPAFATITILNDDF